MIYPEFENEKGEIIIDDTTYVPVSGTAKMWIVSPHLRPYHYDKIVKGLICYFMEGRTKVAKCEVTEILGLFQNPLDRL